MRIESADDTLAAFTVAAVRGTIRREKAAQVLDQSAVINFRKALSSRLFEHAFLLGDEMTEAQVRRYCETSGHNPEEFGLSE